MARERHPAALCRAGRRRQTRSGKDTGAVRFADGDVTVVADLPKRVEWDQGILAGIVERIRASNRDPADYVETIIKVPERRYAAWPKDIRQEFEPARTVRTGKPTFTLTRNTGSSGMTAPALQSVATQNLPTLVDRAAAALTDARTAAEVLEARDLAAIAYDLAKRSARLQAARQAHDDLIAAAHRAQANALEIEARAKHRLADEYDAAQARGEVATRQHNPGSVGHVSDENMPPATADNLGLSRKDVYEARLVRDAEAADPGVVRRSLDETLDRGDEPTKTALREMVVEAAERGMRGGGRKPRAVNPHFRPDPAFDASAGIDGACARIAELFDTHGAAVIVSGCLDRPMLERSIAKMARARDVLTLILEAAHARHADI